MERISYTDGEEEEPAGSSKGKILMSRVPDTDPEEPKGATPPADSEEDDEQIEFDPYQFIRSLPPLTPSMLSRACDIPEKSASHPSKTLVLDLDETLVHCTTNPIPNADLVFPVEFHGEKFQVYVLKRPHLQNFLVKVSELFEVVIFTASQQIYADALLNLIDQERKLIQSVTSLSLSFALSSRVTYTGSPAPRHRLFRESCLCIEGNYLKELSVLKRDLAKTIIVDNSPQAFGYQIDNGIPILSWYEDQNDQELVEILSFLETLVHADDVRPHIRDKFQTFKRIDSTEL